MEWGFYGFRWGEFQVGGVKCEAREASGQPPYFRLQTSHSAEGRFCETKPNLGGLGHVGKGGPRVGAAPPRSEMCETKPNLGGLGHVGKADHRVGGSAWE